jgi:hypothetical protein
MKNPVKNIEQIADGKWTSSGDLLGAYPEEIAICQYANKILKKIKGD